MRNKVKEFFEMLLSFPFMLLIIIVSALGVYQIHLTDAAGLLILFATIVCVVMVAVFV